MQWKHLLVMTLMLGVAMAGCSQQQDPLDPQSDSSSLTYNFNKNGTETLGTPSIDISAGSGFVEGGVGMVGMVSGILTVDVPAGATVNQALLYWAGGTTGAPGDDTISFDGTSVTGELIGGPTNFFSTSGVSYYFSAYRADITDLDLVAAGPNSFTITDFMFDNTGGPLDENNGISLLVIYDDGTTADISILDGLDMAFFDFSPTLDATVPQTFTFAAETADRTADMVIISGSVGEGRPNQIKVTTSAGEQLFSDILGSMDGLLWDSMILPVNVPAGATELTVEIISTASTDPLGASLGWVGAGLSVPVTPPELFCLGDYVWFDENENGCQDVDEMGVEGVEVNLWVGCPPSSVIATTTTTDQGFYEFCELLPGEYSVQFVAPDGYIFCEQFAAGCGTENDSNADMDTGISDCVVIVDADDYTIDAGLCRPPVEEIGCRFTGGGNDTFLTDGGATEVYTFGGQAGAPLASQPQPWGNWTHHQKNGPSGSFVFHAGTPSAPEGTEIDWITCMDPGWCVQARSAPAKQLDFAGVGTFKNMKGAPGSIEDFVDVGESLHWFEVNVDDLGEPGGNGNPEGCDPLGFGRNGGTELADCGCPDFYRIRIYEGSTDASAVMYEVFGYIDHGNLQLHPPTGRDDKLNN